MTIRAILETETMDPDFREPFLNGKIYLFILK